MFCNNSYKSIFYLVVLQGLGVRGWELGLSASLLAQPMNPVKVTASLLRIWYLVWFVSLCYVTDFS